MFDRLKRKLLIRTTGFRKNRDAVTANVEYVLPQFPRSDLVWGTRSTLVRNWNHMQRPLVKYRTNLRNHGARKCRAS